MLRGRRYPPYRRGVGAAEHSRRVGGASTWHRPSSAPSAWRRGGTLRREGRTEATHTLVLHTRSAGGVSHPSHSAKGTTTWSAWRKHRNSRTCTPPPQVLLHRSQSLHSKWNDGHASSLHAARSCGEARGGEVGPTESVEQNEIARAVLARLCVAKPCVWRRVLGGGRARHLAERAAREGYSGVRARAGCV